MKIKGTSNGCRDPPWPSVLSGTGLFVSYWVCGRQCPKAVTVLCCFSAGGPSLGEDWKVASSCMNRQILTLSSSCLDLSRSSVTRCCSANVRECNEARGEKHGPCSLKSHMVCRWAAGLAWQCRRERSALPHSRISILVCVCPGYCFLQVENSVVFLNSITSTEGEAVISSCKWNE